MSAEWTEHREGFIPDGGDVGGDVQSGPAAHRRWQRQAPGGFWQIFNLYVYRARTDPASIEADREWTEEQREYMICRDPDDPGGSEQWSDQTYVEHSPSVDPERFVKDFRADEIDYDERVPKEWL